jgi:predicted RNA binding protein YcfA (HicA-like mRNA interferase family)
LPKLRVLSGGECCAVLALHGFVEVRRKGSHIIMQKRLESSTITVPVPNHKELKTGTLLSIIRQSGLEKSLFQSL